MEGYKPIGKLNPSTLVYTVGAVVISLPSINDDAPTIHKALIEEYPEYSKTEIGVVTQHPIDPLKNREDTIIQHGLNSPDRNWGILLMPERILFHTTSYESFSDFSKRFSSVLKTIQDITGLRHQNGLAFRHIDNIMPLEEGKELSAAIKPKFHTPELSKSVSSKLSKHEYVYATEGRRLIFRLHNYDQGKAPSIPQEIFPNYFGLKMKPMVKVVTKPFVLGDFEANNINEGSPLVKFEIDSMMKELDELHKLVSVAYREVVTSEELKARGCSNAD